MELKRKIQIEARSKVIKAIGHPTRLFMIEELHKGEKCVYELTEMVGVDTSTVSKHLLVLKNAGIVRDEKRGLQVYYTLKVPCIIEFIECIQHVVETNAKENMCLIGAGTDN